MQALFPNKTNNFIKLGIIELVTHNDERNLRETTPKHFVHVSSINQSFVIKKFFMDRNYRLIIPLIKF